MGARPSRAETPEAKEEKVPHMYHHIMKEADVPSSPSMSGLDDRVYSGILLNRKRKKYWVEKGTMNNCFMLFARGLAITWSEAPRHWRWLSPEETSDEEIEVASLINVCWLEIYGKLDTSYLTPGVEYEVLFVVKMSKSTYGWSTPVKLRLKFFDGNVQERTESLENKPREQWIKLKVGEFTAKSNQVGEMEIALFEYESGQWKSGLMVKGIIIQPRSS